MKICNLQYLSNYNCSVVSLGSHIFFYIPISFRLTGEGLLALATRLPHLRHLNIAHTEIRSLTGLLGMEPLIPAMSFCLYWRTVREVLT